MPPVRRRVPASPRTGSCTARCTRAGAPAEHARTSLRTATRTAVRTSAGAAAGTAGTVPRTTARSSVRTARRSLAAAAPSRRLRRRRFPHRSYRRFGRPDRPGRPWVSHPTHLWCSARKAAFAPPPVPMSMILRTPGAACRAGNRATNLVALRSETNLLILRALSAAGPKACLPCNTPSGQRYQIGGGHACAQL